MDEQTAIVSWMEAQDGKAQLKAVKVNRYGGKSEARIISEMDASRQSGFPQMELVGDNVFFAWTEVGENTSQVRTTFVYADHF